jgi:hypothetical protein
MPSLTNKQNNNVRMMKLKEGKFPLTDMSTTKLLRAEVTGVPGQKIQIMERELLIHCHNNKVKVSKVVPMLS